MQNMIQLAVVYVLVSQKVEEVTSIFVPFLYICSDDLIAL